MLGKIHLAVGALGLVVFALQGQYMDLVHDHLVGMDDARRMLYRSGHIYFLLASLLNVVLGTYLPDTRRPVTPVVQWLVSGVVLVAPALILTGFFVEPGLHDLVRPYSRPALFALFGAGVVLSLSAILNRYRR